MAEFNYSSASVGDTSTPSVSRAASNLDDREAIIEALPFITHGLDGGWFGRISTTLILLFGTFGNVMTVIILRRLRSGWSAMNVYLTALALSDTAMLYSGALPMWVRKVLDYDAYASHVVVCKLSVWVINITATLSAWLLVALTVQRAASVVWPHRVNVICTRHKSVVTILVITIVCTLLHSHTLYGVDVMVLGNGTTGKCTFGSVAYQRFWVSVWIRVNMVIYSILPCVCLSLSNVILGWKLAVAMKEAREKFATGRDGQNDSRQKKASSTTVTIIIVSVAFVVITLPFLIYSNLFYGYANSQDARTRELHFFLYDFFFVLGFANFAWNFYLYCLTGSRFREEFKKIVFGRCAPVTSAPESACVTEGTRVSETGNRGLKESAVDTDDAF